MKTKIKKDWFGKEKGKEELHQDSKNWVSEIHLINDEIRFLEHLLSANYIDVLAIGLHKKIEENVKQIAIQKTAGNALLGHISDQEKNLSALFKNDNITDNISYRENHKKLEKEINAYVKKYKDIKQQIFKIVENVMKRTGQKKLVSSKEVPKLLGK